MAGQNGTIIQFCNCKILKNHQLIQDDLWIQDNKIINPEVLFYISKLSSHQKVDCKGAIISPGFIDLQINGGFGHDFSTNAEHVEENVLHVAYNILQHGVTSFCPTVITSPKATYAQIIPRIKKRNGNENGAGILGIHLEGPFLNKDRKGAHPVHHIKDLKHGFVDIVDTYTDLKNVAIITIAPELDPDGNVIKELVKHGITVSLGHSNANIVEGERAMKQGAQLITHLFNAMPPFHHRDPGLVGLLTSEKLSPNKTVYYGIIADGIHTHPAAIRIAYRSNPKGLVLVTDAMSAMGLQPGRYCIGEQHVDVSEKCAVVSGTDTLSGSIATMDSCVRYLKNATKCSVAQALECATLHPAEVLGITEQKGTLDFGTDADFIFLDDDLNIQATYISGQCVWRKDQSI